MLLVLTGIAVERQYDGDALGRRPFERIDHDQVLHDPLVDRSGVALDHEGVAAPDGLLVPHIDLGVGEVARLGGHEFDAQFLGDVLSQFGVGPSTENHEVLLGGPQDAAHDVAAP